MTTDTVSKRVRELAEHHEMDEPAVIQQAVEAGVETLYRDMIVSRYLDDEITREETIEHLGVELVDEVEAARHAAEEDVKWGLRPDTVGCKTLSVIAGPVGDVPVKNYN